MPEVLVSTPLTIVEVALFGLPHRRFSYLHSVVHEGWDLVVAYLLKSFSGPHTSLIIDGAIDLLILVIVVVVVIEVLGAETLGLFASPILDSLLMIVLVV